MRGAVRVQIASDLNHEFATGNSPWRQPLSTSESADLLVLAGNVHTNTQGVELYRHAGVPVVYVNGTHELWGGEVSETRAALRAAAEGTCVSYLECDELRFGRVRVLGCCLWTDYLLGPSRREHAMDEARRFLNDHRLIRLGARQFSPEDALAEHQKSRRWLEEKLGCSFRGKTIVVTHFSPVVESFSQFDNNPLNASDASNLRSLVEGVDLWIHGRIERSARLRIGDALVVCNPRGFPQVGKPGRHMCSQNAQFDPGLIIEV